MCSVFATHVKTYATPMRSTCETLTYFASGLHYVHVYVYEIVYFFYVGGKKRPYFVHITQNKVLFLIVRKEKRKRNINKSQAADTFYYVYVCACACVCNFFVMCLCQEKNETLFCANKVLF